MTAAPGEPTDTRRGTAYGFLAYALWGAFPLYFHALKPAGAWEILAHRIVWTLVVCGGVLLVRRDLAWLGSLIRNWRLSLGITAAALLVAANWVIYVFAVLAGFTYEAALGYFLNPIVTVGLGVVVLGERLRPLQWAAVAVGFGAFLFLAIAGGHMPWISLGLALSFAGYGLVKKKVGASLTAMRSLTAETMVLAPIAVVILLVVGHNGDATFTGHGAWHTALLVLSGVVTAIPLLLFAAAARRIPLVTIGLLQFITPVLQLIAGVAVLHEHVSHTFWIGFGIVWVALALLTIDSVKSLPRRAQRPA